MGKSEYLAGWSAAAVACAAARALGPRAVEWLRAELARLERSAFGESLEVRGYRHGLSVAWGEW